MSEDKTSEPASSEKLPAGSAQASPPPSAAGSILWTTTPCSVTVCGK